MVSFLINTLGCIYSPEPNVLIVSNESQFDPVAGRELYKTVVLYQCTEQGRDYTLSVKNK